MKRGFSIVELLVVMSLVTLLAGSGLFVSLKNTQKQAIEQAAEKLRSAIYQARSNALAGVSSGCSGVFGGWQVIVSTNGYTVEGVCSTGNFSSKTENYPNLIFTTGTILFGPQGQGTSETTLEIQDANFSKTLTITSNGNVTIQ